MIKPRENFHFNPPIQIKGDWMLVLKSLELYSSVFNITEENNKFILFKFPDEKSGGVSYDKFRDEIEGDLDFSDITATYLQADIIEIFIFEEYRNQVTKLMKDDKFMLNLSIYVDSTFQDFESFLTTESNLVEEGIRLVLDEYNSGFVTYDFEPGISEALFNILQLNMKYLTTQLILNSITLTWKQNWL